MPHDQPAGGNVQLKSQTPVTDVEKAGGFSSESVSVNPVADGIEIIPIHPKSKTGKPLEQTPLESNLADYLLQN